MIFWCNCDPETLLFRFNFYSLFYVEDFGRYRLNMTRIFGIKLVQTFDCCISIDTVTIRTIFWDGCERETLLFIMWKKKIKNLIECKRIDEFNILIIAHENNHKIKKINERNLWTFFYASYKLIIMKKKLKKTNYRKYYR